MLYVDVSQHDKLGVRVTGFEELGVELDREVMQLLLRIHGVFDLPLGFLVGVGEMLGSIVAAASLQGELLRILQLDLQGVEAAIKFEALRSEGQDVGIFRSLGSAAEAFVEIIVVVKEN